MSIAQKKNENLLCLIIGHRRGISLALEKLNVPFVIWTNRKVFTKTVALKVISKDYPKKEQELKTELAELTNKEIVVIAGTEDAVFTASLIRKWLAVRRNTHALIQRCTDKYIMKSYLKEKGIPMTEFLSHRDFSSKEKREKLGDPFVAKPRKSSGSRGVEFVKQEQAEKLIQNRSHIFERKLTAKEGSVESFITDHKIIFQNITSYEKIGHINLVPGDFDPHQITMIHELNNRVIKALNIKWGITHLEFYINEKEIYFGEIALRPPGGRIMDAMEQAYDYNFWELFTLIELNFPITELPLSTSYASSFILYPKQGVIEKIPDQQEIDKIPSLVKYHSKLDLGKKVEARKSLGKDYGYCLLKNNNKKQLSKDIKTLTKLLM